MQNTPSAPLPAPLRQVTITAVEASSGHLAGVANVTPGLALAEAGEHVELAQGEAAATIRRAA